MDSVKVYCTSREGDRRHSPVPVTTPAKKVSALDTLVSPKPEFRFQKFLGFGGAFTEASAWIYSQLSEARQKEFIAACFDSKMGNGYVLGRTHMGSCDFSLGNYTNAPVPGDKRLEHFSLAREKQSIIPLLKAAIAYTGGLDLLVSPWSPPAWMKSNGTMNFGGHLLPEYYGVWALYFVKFIQALSEEGIPVHSVTVQNEPQAKQTWDSCIWSPEEEKVFIRDHLIPVFRNHGMEDIKILLWDHNRDIMYARVEEIMSEPALQGKVWGVGYHWYSGYDSELLSPVHDTWPDLYLVSTESTIEGGAKPGRWDRGEIYARHIIGDLNNFSNGWIDWNLLLDMKGGPNHVGNYCDAPILAAVDTDTLTYQSSYWYIGHFSRYIRPGAVRIGLTVTNAEGLETTAFQNVDGSIAVVVMNARGIPRSFNFSYGDGAFTYEIPAHAIVTIVIS